MPSIHEMVEEWRVMKAKLEHQLEHAENEVLDMHAPFTRDTIRRWVVELDDLIIKYSFEI